MPSRRDLFAWPAEALSRLDLRRREQGMCRSDDAGVTARFADRFGSDARATRLATTSATSTNVCSGEDHRQNGSSAATHS